MHPKKNNLLLLALLAVFFFSQCTITSEKPLTIAISKSEPIDSYGNYSKWVHKADADVKIINMYKLGVDSALIVLNSCDALILSGGEDVYPGRYGEAADANRCGTIDYYRDSLEIGLIKKAIEMKMPLVGICRGEQIINVSLGGSLYIDIPQDFDTIIKHRQKDWENCFHQVHINKKSLLSKVCGSSKGIVNSNHHQAVKMIAPDLKATAFSSDGSIEAIEWKDPSDKSFLLAVQWHPERLDSVNATLSLPIIRAFIMQARLYQSEK